jgi:hypothetical protein
MSSVHAVQIRNTKNATDSYLVIELNNPLNFYPYLTLVSAPQTIQGELCR